MKELSCSSKFSGVAKDFVLYAHYIVNIPLPSTKEAISQVLCKAYKNPFHSKWCEAKFSFASFARSFVTEVLSNISEINYWQ